MRDGFIKVATAANKIEVANVKSNTVNIKQIIDGADSLEINVLCLPELCVTGYGCKDLFFSERLIEESLLSLKEICGFTLGKAPTVIIGLPLSFSQKLFNCAAVIKNGELLGIVPKTHIPGYGELSEKRYFASGIKNAEIIIDERAVPFGSDLIFKCKELNDFSFGVEIGEDLLAPYSPSVELAKHGANIIFNPSACAEYTGRAEFRRDLVRMTSARLRCGYVLSGEDFSDSTQDVVFSRHSVIAENGRLLNENLPFENKDFVISEIDVKALSSERAKNTSFEIEKGCFREIYFCDEVKETLITKHIAKNPFVPENEAELQKRCGDILSIQSFALKKRLEHTGAKKAVLGISGGLDSTLALLVTVRAFSLINKPLSDIIAVTMPCFGTTERTKSNAVRLCEALGVTIKEINISASVLSHFEDIGQDSNRLDITFENAQARERTQVLMDIANMTGGIVIGTGDLSELALGWATYNGDHMSMYAVNASVPKTLMKCIVKSIAAKSELGIREILLDIVATPVSPELLPADEQGQINQKTEDLVGPYLLHDFFLYYTLRFGFTPRKILRLALIAFKGDFDKETILHWLKVFTRRFFSQQFKRSCMPDGPKVGSVGLSPRGDWQMPTDAVSKIWLDELNNINL